MDTTIQAGHEIKKDTTRRSYSAQSQGHEKSSDSQGTSRGGSSRGFSDGNSLRGASPKMYYWGKGWLLIKASTNGAIIVLFQCSKLS